MGCIGIYFSYYLTIFLLCPGIVVANTTISPSNSTDFYITTVSRLVSKDQFLPAGWEDMCTMREIGHNNVYFQCTIETAYSGLWRLDTLRDWISSSTLRYHFHVYCSNWSKVSIPWPVKALHLVSLQVHDCLITDFLSESSFGENSSKAGIPDQLIDLKFVDSEISIDIFGLVTYMSNIASMPKDFICGHEDTIVDVALRNITYKFDDTNIMDFLGSFDDEASNSNGSTTAPVNLGNKIMDVGKTFLDENRKIQYKCEYLKLKYIDQSVSATKSRYHIDVLTENSFFKEVRVYNMSRTRMTLLNSKFKTWWMDFPKLEFLDLSYNYIDTFDLDTTAVAWDLPLLHVNVSHNNITRITTNYISKLAKLSSVLIVNLEGNPFHCDCSPDMESVVDLVQNDGVWKNKLYFPYAYLRYLRCATPKSAKGKTFVSLTRADLSCEMTSYAPIIILSVVVVFLLVLIIVMTRYRREIQILTYTRFHVILPCQPHESYQNKLYDAFVSYSSENEGWVRKTFQALEEEEHRKGSNGYNFRFCLHQRDFIAGKTIFDNVIDSVEASHHTVIILSKYFLNSHWCMYEFQEAFQQSIMERKRHLIVVLMEDIPEAELPKELKRCLKTFTYIRKDDAIFHDRLIYALAFKGQKTVVDTPIEPETPPIIMEDKVSEINGFYNIALESDDVTV
ncbi:toll-like receptor Tollo [Pecten maximus]|uniref:toll-like receptor Tollo n=1 Tax=Pecten maximus TaxID=6579 RepID=UPI0014591179|nr:toll-like receptor Tollo [Pecten maximus]